ncbi:MAG TPA: type I-C CRISPR-associated protein Cas7/Csd2, partial [Thermoleophilia bacterium]|nr:type I-C CRISPR-associated protein Cas7/Csd2 [Thermoleophilia bacterium]
ETGQGLVTDVCLKRKVRNYLGLAKEFRSPYDIYVKEKAVLGRAHVRAFQDLKIQLGEEIRVRVPEDMTEALAELTLPEGLAIDSLSDEDVSVLVVAADLDKKDVQQWLKEEKPKKAVADFIKVALKSSKARKPTQDETERGRDWMCQNYYDIRTFGAVLSLKSAPNCGQVRGPVQLTFARSVEPVIPLEHSITRMAVATEAEAEKQQGDNRTMGRKFTIPYALYQCHGFVSAPLAQQTRFSEGDLSLFWQSLEQVFEHDRSAARGEMTVRKLVVFQHESPLGNAPAHKLFDLVSVRRRNGVSGPPRGFGDYEITVNAGGAPAGVNVQERL